MVKYKDIELDEIFSALANKRRREIISMLTENSKTISELAHPLELSLPAIHKHIRMLERADLVVSTKKGRNHEIILNPAALLNAQIWIEEHRRFWNMQLDTLGIYIERKNKDKKNG